MYGQTWARALCDELGCGGYRSGSFARAMAAAVMLADSSNVAAIGRGFPELAAAYRDYQVYGGDYLVALAAGDEDGMDAAYEAYRDRQQAAHDRWLVESS